ncbi:MAG: glyoxalase family protein [Ponticaulis sp.]|nr:glyoxalase family protein [Ponticaulis sp.]
MSNVENSINYIEFPMTDPEAIIVFYETVFGWTFQRWGEDYISFSGAEVEGGFNKQSDVNTGRSGALVILYCKDLQKKIDQIKAAGGKIIEDIYAFPGGRRFHFEDPSGNELAVWSEKD